MSRKYGRKVSKIGYPYFFDLHEGKEDTIIDTTLTLTVGVASEDFDEEYALKLIRQYSFPLKIHVTNDEPVCSLSLRYSDDSWNVEPGNEHFWFESCKREEEGWWTPFYWSNKPFPDDLTNRYTILFGPPILKDNVQRYEESITPCHDSLESVFVMTY